MEHSANPFDEDWVRSGSGAQAKNCLLGLLNQQCLLSIKCKLEKAVVLHLKLRETSWSSADTGNRKPEHGRRSPTENREDFKAL